MVVRGKAIQLSIVHGVTYNTVAKYLQSAVLHFDNLLQITLLNAEKRI